ncbi:hypothetical protein L1987_09271 [Smallanthus sonchifolius]|uniref:Uncharacterized protein n=1 Tax=Smallanthus sonchifolius TaxID=185202 RepID=A0ACB9JMY3_9ASTR|nr:hypothetical protein L1987_09271 [Smallanthus sonchifolius]
MARRSLWGDEGCNKLSGRWRQWSGCDGYRRCPVVRPAVVKLGMATAGVAWSVVAVAVDQPYELDLISVPTCDIPFVVNYVNMIVEDLA